MDEVLRMPVLALIAALLTLVLRKQSPELGLVLTLCACVLGSTLLLSAFKPVLRLTRSLAERAELDAAQMAPVWKCLGLGLLTELCSAVCADAGQSALAKLVELGGTVLCLAAALPLLQAVLALIEELL